MKSYLVFAGILALLLALATGCGETAAPEKADEPAPGEQPAAEDKPDVKAEDDCGEVKVVCEPPSGSSFPPGSTVVTCTATDAAGNTAV